MEFLYFLLIGLVVGWLAGQIWKGGGFGLIGNLIVGVLGAFIGGFLARIIGIGGEGLLAQILISVGGAIVLLWVLGVAKKNHTR